VGLPPSQPDFGVSCSTSPDQFAEHALLLAVGLHEEVGETMTEASNPSTKESRIIAAADDIRDMTNEVQEGSAHSFVRRSPRLAQQLRQLTLEAPLHSLAIAFLLGALIARRR
jgi:hypothetical protein